MGKNKEKGFDIKKDNNNIDPYGYDFVPTIAHWTNIDEQRKIIIMSLPEGLLSL